MPPASYVGAEKQTQVLGVGEMTQRLGALVALGEDRSSVPGTNTMDHIHL